MGHKLAKSHVETQFVSLATFGGIQSHEFNAPKRSVIPQGAMSKLTIGCPHPVGAGMPRGTVGNYKQFNTTSPGIFMALGVSWRAPTFKRLTGPQITPNAQLPQNHHKCDCHRRALRRLRGICCRCRGRCHRHQGLYHANTKPSTEPRNALTDFRVFAMVKSTPCTVVNNWPSFVFKQKCSTLFSSPAPTKIWILSSPFLVGLPANLATASQTKSASPGRPAMRPTQPASKRRTPSVATRAATRDLPPWALEPTKSIQLCNYVAPNQLVTKSATSLVPRAVWKCAAFRYCHKSLDARMVCV